MASAILQLDKGSLDPRILWSREQHALAQQFENLVSKCNALGSDISLVLVTTAAVQAHVIAAFNLASAFSFDCKTLLLDTTPKTALLTGLLDLPNDVQERVAFLNGSLAVASSRDPKILPSTWPSAVHQNVGERMLSLVTARDAFQIDWQDLDPSVKVIALVSPSELEEERWNHLLTQVSAQRFLGLWVVD